MLKRNSDKHSCTPKNDLKIDLQKKQNKISILSRVGDALSSVLRQIHDEQLLWWIFAHCKMTNKSKRTSRRENKIGTIQKSLLAFRCTWRWWPLRGSCLHWKTYTKDDARQKRVTVIHFFVATTMEQRRNVFSARGEFTFARETRNY